MLEDGAEAVRDLQRGERGALSVVLVGTLASTKFVNMLRQFGRRHPDVKLELRTANSQEVSDLVGAGEATLGLRYFTAVVMRRLAGERWVAFPAQRRRRDPFTTALEQRLTAAGIEPTEIVRIDSLTAQKRFVEAGFGIALLIASSVQEELRFGTLETIDVPALRGSVPVTLVRRRNAYLRGAAQTLVAVITAAATKRATRARARRWTYETLPASHRAAIYEDDATT